MKISVMAKQIKIACAGATALPLDDIVELQGELKSLSKENYEKLKSEIRENGFSFPINVWRSPENVHYILDGHQRFRTVRRMVEQEGYELGYLPVSYVEAENMAQARHKLLAAASSYGKVETQGLYEFLSTSEISPDELAKSFNFHEVDMPKFIEEHFLDSSDPLDVGNVEDEEPTDDAPAANEMRHASGHVRMVQLFFNDETHPEFLEKTAALAESMGRDNLTDTIMEIVRESYQTRISNRS